MRSPRRDTCLAHLLEGVPLVAEVAAVVHPVTDVRQVDALAVGAAPLFAGARLAGHTAPHACHLAAGAGTDRPSLPPGGRSGN